MLFARLAREIVCLEREIVRVPRDFREKIAIAARRMRSEFWLDIEESRRSKRRI